MSQGIFKSSRTFLGTLKEKKGQLKQKLAVLTGNANLYHQGQREEMTGRLEVKLHKSVQELNNILFNQ